MISCKHPRVGLLCLFFSASQVPGPVPGIWCMLIKQMNHWTRLVLSWFPVPEHENPSSPWSSATPALTIQRLPFSFFRATVQSFYPSLTPALLLLLSKDNPPVSLTIFITFSINFLLLNIFSVISFLVISSFVLLIHHILFYRVWNKLTWTWILALKLCHWYQPLFFQNMGNVLFSPLWNNTWHMIVCICPHPCSVPQSKSSSSTRCVPLGILPLPEVSLAPLQLEKFCTSFKILFKWHTHCEAFLQFHPLHLNTHEKKPESVNPLSTLP